MQTKRYTLKKSERLSSESRIGDLFNGGRRGGVAPLKFCWKARPREGEAAGEGTGRRTKTGPGAEGAGSEKKGEERGEAAVSVLFSVPKKAFKKAWKRNLIKRRMRESYRCRKHELTAAAEAAGRRLDIALICAGEGGGANKGAKGRAGAKPGAPANEIPDFKTIDNAIAKILEKIAAQNRA